MPVRVVLLTTSPRVAPGLLTGQAWSVLRSAGAVWALTGHPLVPHVQAEGIGVRLVDGPVGPPDAPAVARRLRDAALDLAAGDGAVDGGGLVWLVATDGDRDLGLALGELAERGGLELELLPGSYDLPGARLLDLVSTMDRLRSPGGCPWDAKQTHESLTTYLLEETYETLEAIENGDRDHLREELGDLLLQVVFHARLAAEHPQDPWTVDEVAADIVTKLVRRHPHVFGPDRSAPTAEAVEATWHTSKALEKGRESAVDGVPSALPALALAAKLMHRAASHGVAVDLPEDGSVGVSLLRLVAEARDAGLDAEAELRRAAAWFAAAVRAAER